MSRISKEVEYVLALTGFYGTVSFTALVLILSFPGTWRQNFYGLPGDLYVDTVVLLLSTICALCVLTSYGYFLLASVVGDERRIKMDRIVRLGVSASQLLLLVIFPLILIPFTWKGLVLLGVGEVIGFFWIRRMAGKRF